MFNTPVTLKDLLIGILFGVALSIASNIAFRPNPPKMKGLMKDEVFELRRENARLEGENEYYKKFVDSTITVLTPEQKMEILQKM
jgi:hypothetical protein